MPDLLFSELRKANVARLPEFRDAHGRPCHPPIEGQPPGFNWALSQWSNAVAGEVGEVANLTKKIERGDYFLSDVREKLGDELCDIITYVDILAHRAGINLPEAMLRKWNAVSERVGSDVRLMGHNPAHEGKEGRVEDFKGSLSSDLLDNFMRESSIELSELQERMAERLLRHGDQLGLIGLDQGWKRDFRKGHGTWILGGWQAGFRDHRGWSAYGSGGYRKGVGRRVTYPASTLRDAMRAVEQRLHADSAPDKGGNNA